jgi:hypothetical protein
VWQSTQCLGWDSRSFRTIASVGAIPGALTTVVDRTRYLVQFREVTISLLGGPGHRFDLASLIGPALSHQRPLVTSSFEAALREERLAARSFQSDLKVRRRRRLAYTAKEDLQRAHGHVLLQARALPRLLEHRSKNYPTA